MKARVSWNRPKKAWVIRWEDGNGACEKFFHPKDVNPETEYGYIPEEFICTLYDLQDRGYSIVLID